MLIMSQQTLAEERRACDALKKELDACGKKEKLLTQALEQVCCVVFCSVLVC